MKKLLVVLMMFVVCGCQNDERFLVSFCEAQDLDSHVIEKYNRSTGESSTEVECADKDYDIKMCKPDNGQGQEC